MFDADTALGGPYRGFPSTRELLIQAASRGGAVSREAVNSVIEAYWKPAYKHVRGKWKRSNEESKDLVQGFFTALLEQDLLARFDPARGTFRNYFRTCLDHFVLKQHEYASREKRGGGYPVLDFEEAEKELAATAYASAEEIFFLEWRRHTIALALEDFKAQCFAGGHLLRHRLFEQYDLCETARPRYSDLAREHNIPETAVVNHLAWARREVRRLVSKRLEAVTSGAAELHRETRALIEKPGRR